MTDELQSLDVVMRAEIANTLTRKIRHGQIQDKADALYALKAALISGDILPSDIESSLLLLERTKAQGGSIAVRERATAVLEIYAFMVAPDFSKRIRAPPNFRALPRYPFIQRAPATVRI